MEKVGLRPCCGQPSAIEQNRPAFGAPVWGDPCSSNLTKMLGARKIECLLWMCGVVSVIVHLANLYSTTPTCVGHRITDKR